MNTTTHVITGAGEKYLAQLCKHFGHKIDVEQTETQAIFHFGAGQATVRITDRGLELGAQASTAAGLEKVQSILGSHLERFSFRENLVVTWPGQDMTRNTETA